MIEPEKDPKFRDVMKTLADLWRRGASGRFEVHMDGKGSVWVHFEAVKVQVTGAGMPRLVVLTDN